MNSIETRMVIGGIDASYDMGSGFESHSEKLPINDTTARHGQDIIEFNLVRIEMSFAPYGTHNEVIALIVKNMDTGEVIREIPLKKMQKLKIYLDVFA